MLYSNSRCADHIENPVLLLLRAFMSWALPINGRCLPSHCLATGLYATILFTAKMTFFSDNKIFTQSFIMIHYPF
jgi:hypothetical protein